MREFVYRDPGHLAVMRRRREWFERVQLHTALWWVPTGHKPAVVEAEDRLEYLRAHGRLLMRSRFAGTSPPMTPRSPSVTIAGSVQPEGTDNRNRMRLPTLFPAPHRWPGLGWRIDMERQARRVDAERGRPACAGRVGTACAERTLALFEAQAPGDTRPREAIEGAQAFARGELRIGPVRALSVRAQAAAREVGDPAAAAAARAAGHAAEVAHMAGHALRAPAYGAKAAGLAATDDPAAAVASSSVRGAPCRLPPRTTHTAGILSALGSNCSRG